jgi:hypothetical protein
MSFNGSVVTVAMVLDGRRFTLFIAVAVFDIVLLKLMRMRKGPIDLDCVFIVVVYHLLRGKNCRQGNNQTNEKEDEEAEQKFQFLSIC